jgi:uncharacterized protein YhaN
MKILRLELRKFGPFTGETLTLAEGNFGLHVIYGRNEAGKSSALRALTQLLYGIPHTSADNFVHPYADLRIAAELESVAGQRLAIVRRKGQSKTLRGDDDVEVIDPVKLGQMLDGIDESAFRQRFGIDYQGLVSGGKAIATGGGELGEILFAAASGVSDLGLIQTKLAGEAAELFKPRGSVQRINQAVTDLATARKAIKEAQLATADWVAHDKALHQAESRKDELEGKLLAMRTEEARLRRISDALPLIARRERLLAELAETGDGPSLPSDFAERRRQATIEFHTAERQKQEADDALEQIRREIDMLDLPAALLDHAGAVNQLKEFLGSYRKAAGDRTGLALERDQLEKDARQILEDLGQEPQLERAQDLRLTQGRRQKIHDLGREREKLTTLCDTALVKQRTLQHEIDAAGRELQSQKLPRDTTELSHMVHRAQQSGDIEQRLFKASSALDRLTEQTRIDLQKLPLWSRSLEDLERLPAPGVEFVDQIANDLDTALATQKSVGQRLAELQSDLSNLDTEIEQHRLQQDVPTESDLEAIRSHRDAGWKLFLSTSGGEITNHPEAAAFIQQFAPGGDFVTAYDASVKAADNLADRLRREAGQVAMKARQLAERRQMSQRLAEANQQLQNAGQRVEEVQRQWTARWQSLEIEPLSPREMRSWLKRHSDLVAAARSIREQQQEVSELKAKVTSLCAALAECLRPLGEPDVRTDESLDSLLERCTDVVANIKNERDRRDIQARDVQRAAAELPHAEMAVKDAQDKLDRWREEWGRAIESLGLGAETTASEANSVLDSIQTLHEKLAEADRVRSRIAGIDADAEKFHNETARLTALVASDLANLSAEQAAGDMHDRLIKAERAQTRQKDLDTQRAREETKRAAAVRQIEESRIVIDGLCRQANCRTVDELPEAEQKSEKRRDAGKQLNTVEDDLSRLTAGTSVAEFIVAAKETSPDQLAPSLRQLESEIKALEVELGEVREIMGTERNELARMDGGARAAQAQEHVELLLARIASDAEQYIRLQMASAILKRAVERYRRKNQDPILKRAQDLFAELTLRSFSGLRADYNDKGEPVLLGIRGGGNGQAIGVDGMSDGTCDQLYLALRLASLESYLAEKEPLPFVVDDILIKFDDERAVAALRALARLSERTQVIFFTHHKHVVNLASEHLPKDHLFIHRLDRCPIGSETFYEYPSS